MRPSLPNHIKRHSYLCKLWLPWGTKQAMVVNILCAVSTMPRRRARSFSHSSGRSAQFFPNTIGCRYYFMDGVRNATKPTHDARQIRVPHSTHTHPVGPFMHELRDVHKITQSHERYLHYVPTKLRQHTTLIYL